MKLPCLDIIIPHYKEPYGLVRHLLDSINNQVGINLQNTIKVTIVNDAQPEYANALTEALKTAQYNFDINVIIKDKNEGAGRARQCGLDRTELPYVMFCDADDCLYDCSALFKLLNCIRLLEAKGSKWNYIWSNFYEEFIGQDGKQYDLLSHEKPSMIWMHGKVWNREFLNRYNIQFHPTLRTFEDTYFGKIAALVVPKARAYHCDEHIYLWKRNPNSVTAAWNHDNRSYLYWNNHDYITCTYGVLKFLYPNYKMVERWLELFMVSVMFTYFLLQFREYNDLEELTLTKRQEVKQLFADIVRDFGDSVKDATNYQKLKWYNNVRADISNRYNFAIEQIGWNDFLKEIDAEFNVGAYDLLKITNE